MGLFDKLVSKLTGKNKPVQAPTPARPQSASAITVTISSPTPLGQISDAEVAKRAREHVFVLTTDPPSLKTADEWWNEETHKRPRREGTDKAYAWLLPFVSLDVAKLPQLQPVQEWGPHSAGAMTKELRAIIRERRKAKESPKDLLKALYGTCVLADVGKSLSFEGMGLPYMARFVDIREFETVTVDYAALGYQCIESLSKTDVKWLVEAFGEPAEHQSFDAAWPGIRRNAVARYCWSELRSSNEAAKSLGLPQKSMKDWLNELVHRNIGYHKEWQERVMARRAYLAELSTVLDTAWAATRRPFVVADLETTGLNADANEVLEFAAVRSAPDGSVLAEFSALVRVVRVPAEVTRLTGITQDMVDREGRPLAEAMKAFADFVGPQPLFFHNAPFDQGFLKKASTQSKVKLVNTVHDTLPMTRQAWPSLVTYKLVRLAEHVGAPTPTHRALSDVKAALAVLLAARKEVEGKA